MRQLSQLLPLPSALLILLAGAPRWSLAAADTGLVDLPALPTSPAELRLLHRRHAEIEHRLANQAPVAVRKMSEDPSEKFFPEYWTFGVEGVALGREALSGGSEDTDDASSIPTHRTARPIQEAESVNSSFSTDMFLPPILLHHRGSSVPLIAARGVEGSPLDRRDYMCPTDFHDCSSIGHVNSCCADGQFCKIIPNAGIGVVGCCPKGRNCRGSVSSCDTAAGFRSCPHQRNKNGCCEPGFRCDAIGCVKIVGGTTVTTTRQVTVAQTSATSTHMDATTDAMTVYTTTTYPTETKIVGPVVETFQTETEVVTATVTRVGPSMPPTTQTIAGVCPVGYYRCEAFYLGGCCRVGRKCHSTHCPAGDSTPAIPNGIVTIIVESGLGATTITEDAYTIYTSSTPISVASVTSMPTGPCALGWSPCGVAGGGGCCPDGYACAASCIATQGGLPGKVLKAPPTNHGRTLQGQFACIVAIAAAAAFGMIWL